MPEETYVMVARCGNCGYTWRENLKKGVPSEKQPTHCPYCGCMTQNFHKPVYDFEGRPPLRCD